MRQHLKRKPHIGVASGAETTELENINTNTKNTQQFDLSNFHMIPITFSFIVNEESLLENPIFKSVNAPFNQNIIDTFYINNKQWA